MELKQVSLGRTTAQKHLMLNHKLFSRFIHTKGFKYKQIKASILMKYVFVSFPLAKYLTWSGDKFTWDYFYGANLRFLLGFLEMRYPSLPILHGFVMQLHIVEKLPQFMAGWPHFSNERSYLEYIYLYLHACEACVSGLLSSRKLLDGQHHDIQRTAIKPWTWIKTGWFSALWIPKEL